MEIVKATSGGVTASTKLYLPGRCSIRLAANPISTCHSDLVFDFRPPIDEGLTAPLVELEAKAAGRFDETASHLA